MNSECIAVISDIHGNRDALEAVFSDIDRRGITHIVNLGDCFYGPLDPAGTADLLLARNIPTVCGNEDRIIFDQQVSSESNPTLKYTREVLHSEHIQWLERLPKTRIEFESCLLCHGTPLHDNRYLLYQVTSEGLSLRTASAVRSSIPEIAGMTVVLCGHSHLPGKLQCPDGPLVVDAGSVGLPAFSDDKPYFHRVSTGSPHARYSILTFGDQGCEVADVSLDYDWSRAASLSEQNGRPEWSKWLKTGIA